MNARHLPANALAKALGPAGAESTPAVHLPPTPGQLVSCKLPTRWGEFDLRTLIARLIVDVSRCGPIPEKLVRAQAEAHF